jgi:hypothetical protein
MLAPHAKRHALRYLNTAKDLVLQYHKGKAVGGAVARGNGGVGGGDGRGGCMGRALSAAGRTESVGTHCARGACIAALVAERVAGHVGATQAVEEAGTARVACAGGLTGTGVVDSCRGC